MTDRYAEICRSHWQQYESDDEHAERVERCSLKAGEYFDDATREQKAEYDQTIAVIAAYKGSPRWARMRDAAKKRWYEATQPARDLFLDTFDELMRDGEMAESTGDRWDALAHGMAADHRRDERKQVGVM